MINFVINAERPAEIKTGALPPIFTANFEGEAKFYGHPEVDMQGVISTHAGLVLDRPGESYVEFQFQIAHKGERPYQLFMNQQPTAAIITLNGVEVPSSFYITDLLHEGQNTLRIGLPEHAEDSALLMHVAISVDFNPFKNR